MKKKKRKEREKRGTRFARVVGQGTGCRRSPTHPVSSFNNWLALAVHYTSSHRTRTCATGSSPAGSSREWRPTASFPGGAHAVDGGQAAKAGLRKENRLDTQNGSWFRPQYPHNGQCELASRSAARAQRAARLVYDDGSEGDAGQVRRRACRRRRRLRRQRRRRQQPVRLLGGDRFGDTFDVQL